MIPTVVSFRWLNTTKADTAAGIMAAVTLTSSCTRADRGQFGSDSDSAGPSARRYLSDPAGVRERVGKIVRSIRTISDADRPHDLGAGAPGPDPVALRNSPAGSIPTRTDRDHEAAEPTLVHLELAGPAARTGARQPGSSGHFGGWGP